MSYVRNMSPYIHVDGVSQDYIYGGSEGIVAYGCSNETLIEILCRRWDTDDKDIKKFIIQRLAERLNVKLRKRPLTMKQWFKAKNKLMGEWEKNYEEAKKQWNRGDKYGIKSK